MPGVADQIRRTQLKQDQDSRKQEMEELKRLVQEDRLHEADERQLETLRLINDIQKSLSKDQVDTKPTGDISKEIVDTIKQTIDIAMKNISTGVSFSTQEDNSRPVMKHTSLSNLTQTDDTITISHSDKLGKDETGVEDTNDKLKKLKKLKR